MALEHTNWAGKYVKVRYSDGKLGDNIGFVEKDEGDDVRAWWRRVDDSCTSSSNRKPNLQIVRPSEDDKSWVELRGLSALVKY